MFLINLANIIGIKSQNAKFMKQFLEYISFLQIFRNLLTKFLTAKNNQFLHFKISHFFIKTFKKSFLLNSKELFELKTTSMVNYKPVYYSYT
jgi:hypothetical protein